MTRCCGWAAVNGAFGSDSSNRKSGEADGSKIWLDLARKRRGFQGNAETPGHCRRIEEALQVIARLTFSKSYWMFKLDMVPKKGLEPPHPCGYMDLNHARLPIPPLRQVTTMRGGWAALKEDATASILQG